MRIFLTCGAALVALAGCAADPSTTRALSRQVPVDDGFFSSAIEWTNRPDSYSYAFRVFADDSGVYEVCGAGAYLDAQNRSVSREILADMNISVNGAPILSDFTFFSTVRNKTEIATAKANCVLSDVALLPGDQNFQIGRDGRKSVFRVD